MVSYDTILTFIECTGCRYVTSVCLCMFLIIFIQSIFNNIYQ